MEQVQVPQVISLLSVLSSLLLCMSIIMVDCRVITNDSDRLALLTFKNEITQDPLGTLSSWNDSLHFCQWRGVTCSRRHPSRVTVLDLQSQKLVGSISPHIGNLSFLKMLNLNNNSFNGEIPQEVGRLFRLQRLILEGNDLGGEIPVNLSRCFNLIHLRLPVNKLVGRIPDELGVLSNLLILHLHKNNLTGHIPASLGNLTSLTALTLFDNKLEGSIPSALSRLASLRVLYLAENNLSGLFPPSLYNLSSLVFFNLVGNQLQGSLPSDIGLMLPNLFEFSIAQNKFTGPIPGSLPNISGLQYIQLALNNFVGLVPNNLGDLKSLVWLAVSTNSLGSGKADDLNFLTSLINCSSLERLFMDDNNFGGMLPNSIANLSTKLMRITLGRNQIYGSIPTGIQNLVGLTLLGFEQNLFTGSIPTGIGKLQNLIAIFLGENKLSGKIPSSFGNLTQLSLLSLVENNLIGRIPSTLGSCKNLQEMYLSVNKLSGTIPEQVIGLSSLSISLDLRNNFLTGSLPQQVGNLKNLGALILNENKLSGEIPSTLGKCSSLRILQMEGNFFQGNIPKSLSFLKGLEDLSLARNNLSGRIPRDFENLSALKSLNLSFNDLEGEVPRDGVFKNLSAISVDGNSKLCGGIPELKLPNCLIRIEPEKRKKSLSFKVIIIIIVIVVLCLTLIMFFLILYWRKKSKTKLPVTNFDIGNKYLAVSYNELLKATNGFGSTNLLGVGCFGSVYKGVLQEDEKPVAVKVLNLQQRGATKSFMAECDALRKVRHRNLLKIITCCSSTDFQGNDFKALVFEFMANGSLENWLYPNINADDQLQWRNLSLEQRLNIAIDVASALDYLHHHCQTPIVHCDLKPSNVLLDDDLIAHVGDFGLAKFLSNPSSYSGQNEHASSIAIKGSIGYVAPEYGMGGEVSKQGDVYSYGILLLEMFTGKRPIDDIFKDGLSLHNFSKMALPLRVLEIVDSHLLLEAEGEDDEVINQNVENGRRHITRDQMQEILAPIIRIGVICSSELPSDRTSMDEVIMNLQVVKDLFLGVRM